MNDSAARRMRARRGYSLLEVLIATAVLAGSAMVLSSMIARGAKAGADASRRTYGLGVAASVMDELIALRRFDPADQEGIVGVENPWLWRASIEPEPTFGMLRIVVEVIEGSEGESDAWNRPDAARRSVRLVRWTRAPQDPRNDSSGSSPGRS